MFARPGHLPPELERLIADHWSASAQSQDDERDRESGAIAIELQVWLRTAVHRQAGKPGVRLSSAHAQEAAYWTPAQLIAHHTSGGCNLQPGDLLGSGTLSGPLPGQSGSLLELTRGGREAIDLGDGQTRSFLTDGDAVTLRGHCARPGARSIGFGSCVGSVVEAGPRIGAGLE